MTARPENGRERDASADDSEERAKRRRQSRRASLPAPTGSDPAPEDPLVDAREPGENDDRLRQDRPPHWG